MGPFAEGIQADGDTCIWPGRYPRPISEWGHLGMRPPRGVSENLVFTR